MSDIDDLSDDVQAFKQRLKQASRKFLREAATVIGGRATTRHMRNLLSSESPHSNPQTGPGTLRRQQGRLARSLPGARSAQTTDSSMRGAPGSIFDITVTPNGAVLTYGSKVPYAAIHEHGGSIPVTDRMRGFFWAKHAATGAVRWKRLAIAAEQNQAFHIPARPYLEPALSGALPKLQDMAADRFIEAFQSTLN